MAAPVRRLSMAERVCVVVVVVVVVVVCMSGWVSVGSEMAGCGFIAKQSVRSVSQ